MGGLRRPWRAAGLLTTAVLAATAPVAQPLRPEEDLTSNCFNFPETTFSRINNIRHKYGSSPHVILTEGSTAIDFTLRDTDGEPFTLSQELAMGRPVVLFWGMHTCPAFQGLGGDYPFDQVAYWDENAVIEAFQERVTFVHLYGPEPHPYPPDANFDSGTIRTQYWSVVRQPLTFDDRLVMAARVRPLVHPAARVLPESLPGNPDSDLVNAVWCSYVTGARAAIGVGADGVVFHAEGWFNREMLVSALQEYLDKNNPGAVGEASNPPEW